MTNNQPGIPEIIKERIEILNLSFFPSPKGRVMGQPQTLSWGIKESLLAYIESLDDGEIVLVDPATQEGDKFLFQLDEVASDFDDDTLNGLLQFTGSVMLTGYYGAMKIQIRNPQISLQDGKGHLSVIVESVFTGERFDPIAVLSIQESGSETTFTSILTVEGQMVLGPQYQPGQELSPVTIS